MPWVQISKSFIKKTIELLLQEKNYLVHSHTLKQEIYEKKHY